MKKILSLFLFLVMLLCITPMIAFAAENNATVSPYLQQLPSDLIGCTNLYDVLTPVKGYYTATKYDTSNGEVLSVVIPVEPGDRIASSSFAARPQNMGSVNGIRVTYLLGDKIVSSLSAGSVYSTYTSVGYITVPEGVDAVSIPWWKPSDSNWMTLSQISKDYAIHSPKSVVDKAPTCTEVGYTSGEICEICNASLSARVEIPAIGHSYNDESCTACGAINLKTILSGKYVSVLGDSISTFKSYSNDSSINSTIGKNAPRYDLGVADTKPGSYCLLESVNDTWWMNFANRGGMKLLVNNSWAGSQVFGGEASGGRVIPAAYLDRCVNLHDNTLSNNPENKAINPDVIFVYLGINDYNFNRSKVGSGAVDYASLIDSNGSYVTPESFGEAYAIMLHKMKTAYPYADIFAMTLLPASMYSVDKTAWEQHNFYIRAAAEYYGIPVVDLATRCAITWENHVGYMMDKIHPTTKGMKLISDCIEAELQAYYKENPPYNEPVITKHPTSGEAKMGERYCVTVEAKGEGLTYQWYGRNAGDSYWFKSIVTDNTYDDVMTSARADREVYCVITDKNGNSVTTEIVKLVCLPSEKLEILTQPTNSEALLGERYCVSVEANGEGLRYQWYFRNAGSDEWFRSGVTDNTYDDIMTTARMGREVYCVITDRLGNTVTTSTVKLICVQRELIITSQPKDDFAYMGDVFCSTVKANGDGLKYQWYFRNAGSVEWVRSGVRDNTYDDVMTKDRANREIYCVITDMWGNSVSTDIVKLIPVATVELELLDVTYDAANMGDRYCITVDVQGENLTYQWYFCNAGSDVWFKSGVTDNTYDDVMTTARASRKVYCVITDACGNKITTDVITLTPSNI